MFLPLDLLFYYIFIVSYLRHGKTFGSKIVISENKTLASERIKDKSLDHIKKLLSPEYNLENPVYPTSICNRCRILLSQADKG